MKLLHWQISWEKFHQNVISSNFRNTDDVLKNGKWVLSIPYLTHFMPCAIYSSYRLKTWEVQLKEINWPTSIEQFWIIGFNYGQITRPWNLVLICSFYSRLKLEIVFPREYIFATIFKSNQFMSKRKRQESRDGGGIFFFSFYVSF